MGWSVSWSIQKSIITFIETLKLGERSLQKTLQIYPRTLQEHSTSLDSVPCAYFRVSLRDYAHSLVK
jgi:hypothetical protein